MACAEDQSEKKSHSKAIAYSKPEHKIAKSILINQICKPTRPGEWERFQTDHESSSKSSTKSVTWAEPLYDFFQPTTFIRERQGPIPPYARLEYFSALIPYNPFTFHIINGTVRGDARARRIKNICNCNMRATQLTHKLNSLYPAMLVEIAYDLRNGNHKGCIKMLTQLLTEEQRNVSTILIFYPFQAVYLDSGGYRFLKNFTHGSTGIQRLTYTTKNAKDTASDDGDRDA